MSTVIVGIIPPAAVDTRDTGLRPREGIGEPSRQFPCILAESKFCAVTFPLAGQDETLYLNLTAETLAVAIVKYIVYFPVVAFE